MNTKKSSTQVTVNPQASFNSALADGSISRVSHEILVENLNTLTTLGAQGVSPDDLAEDRVTIFVPVLDASGSRFNESDLMRSEYNKMLDALKLSKASHTILVSSWMFNTSTALLHGFVSLDDAERLDVNNYNPDGGTAMFDAMLNALTSTTAYAKSLLDQGYRVKVVIVLITDGEDNSSDPSTLGNVKKVIADLLTQEIYVFSMIAFGTGYAQSAARNMGIPDLNVIEFGGTDRDIRNAFSLVSSSVIRQSQTQIGGSSSFFAP